MQASKKIPFEDPTVLTSVRILYVVSNLIIAGIYLYVKQQIDKKRGTSQQQPAAPYDASARIDSQQPMANLLAPS